MDQQQRPEREELAGLADLENQQDQFWLAEEAGQANDAAIMGMNELPDILEMAEGDDLPGIDIQQDLDLPLGLDVPQEMHLLEELNLQQELNAPEQVVIHEDLVIPDDLADVYFAPVAEPGVPVMSTITNQSKHRHPECMICQEGYRVEDLLLRDEACGETFHYECVTRWLQDRTQSGDPQSCPNCRMPCSFPGRHPEDVPEYRWRRYWRKWNQDKEHANSETDFCARSGHQEILVYRAKVELAHDKCITELNRARQGRDQKLLEIQGKYTSDYQTLTTWFNTTSQALQSQTDAAQEPNEEIDAQVHGVELTANTQARLLRAKLEEDKQAASDDYDVQNLKLEMEFWQVHLEAHKKYEAAKAESGSLATQWPNVPFLMEEAVLENLAIIQRGTLEASNAD